MFVFVFYVSLVVLSKVLAFFLFTILLLHISFEAIIAGSWLCRWFGLISVFEEKMVDWVLIKMYGNSWIEEFLFSGSIWNVY